ncbi:MAG: phosphate signaling complex protein PhoU [Ignavibacteriaceae bacterium]|jgi:phosphate transport system protein|nr:phosphate signaling complex protein PhoU [Ignavibacteriaceae bacterium]
MERLLDEHIEKLKSRVIKMCSLVDEQVQSAIKAVEEENIELAKQVIEKDSKVDKYDNKIDKICQKIFALTQPVALDLRLIMSSLTINNNLERIGDIAVNIAEYLTMIEKKPAFFNQTKLDPMFKIAKQMLKDAIDSYIQGNENLAKSVITSDDALDKLNVDNHKILVDIMKQDKNNIDSAVVLLVMSRQLERLGDHCTNIAEDVFFIVEAHIVKHKYEKYLFGDDKDDNDD